MKTLHLAGHLLKGEQPEGRNSTGNFCLCYHDLQQWKVMSGQCFLRWLYIFICCFQASQSAVSHSVKLVSHRQRKAHKDITIFGLVPSKECWFGLLFIIWFFKDFIYLFSEGREGREEERERIINVWLPLMHPQLGAWASTQAGALT